MLIVQPFPPAISGMVLWLAGEVSTAISGCTAGIAMALHNLTVLRIFMADSARVSRDFPFAKANLEAPKAHGILWGRGSNRNHNFRP